MIPFYDLKKVNEPYLIEFQKQLPAFFEKSWYILGHELAFFENNFANYCGTKYAIGVGNGLDALTLIFKGYMLLGKLKKGDQIMVPAHTFIASILAIKEAGLEPVFIEPDYFTFNISINDIEKKLTKNIKAILCVHLYGQLAEINELIEICEDNQLLFIEDAAQAHGAHFNGQRAGSFGHAAAFSFYPSKNLGALGDGGCITTSDDVLNDVLKKLRNYGSAEKYVYDFQGVNSRLDDIQALFLNIKLKDLDEANKKRQAIAKYYSENMSHPWVTLPVCEIFEQHVFHLYVIKVKNREEFAKKLKEKGIETLIHYPMAPHKQQAFSSYNHLDLPLTEQLQYEVLSLPMSPVMTIDETKNVVEIINNLV